MEFVLLQKHPDGTTKPVEFSSRFVIIAKKVCGTIQCEFPPKSRVPDNVTFLFQIEALFDQMDHISSK